MSPLEFWYLFGEPVEACQPVVFFLGEAAIGDAFGGRRLGVWLGRKDRIVALQPALCSGVDFETELQFPGDGFGLRLRSLLVRLGLLARLHLHQRLFSDRRRTALS